MLPAELSKRAIDELIVEGNILLKATDMDINLGPTLRIEEQSSWFEKRVGGYLARELPDLNSIFDIEYLSASIVRRTATRAVRIAINRLRDRYMRDIYQTVTVNLSHLASTILLKCAEQGTTTLSERFFREALYLSVKRAAKSSGNSSAPGTMRPGTLPARARDGAFCLDPVSRLRRSGRTPRTAKCPIDSAAKAQRGA